MKLIIYTRKYTKYFHIVLGHEKGQNTELLNATKTS